MTRETRNSSKQSITLPGSKSITNRDLVIAALTDGETILRSILLSDDTLFMIEALQKLGIKIEKNDDCVKVFGGIGNIECGDIELYIGQSGLCMRFLTAFIILNKKGTIRLTGEEKLLSRPMGELFDALTQMGVKFESDGAFPPVKVFPSKITCNKVQMKGDVTSQFFTAVLQIAPVINNGLEIEVIGELVSKPYIDLSINEISKFGVEIINNDYKSFIVKPQSYKPVDLIVEGDASALSYIANFIVLHGGEIVINNLGFNTKQGDYKYLEKLKPLGLEYISEKEKTILKSKGIKNTNISSIDEIDFEDMPDVSMSFMSLAIFIQGKTVITGLQTLNLKECKRLDVMKFELEKLGVEAEITSDSITIGEIIDFPEKTIKIETYNDHRIAMVFGTLNSYIGNLNILNPDCVNKTYPNFWKDLERLK